MKQQIRVIKFGGTSVDDAECFRRVLTIIAKSHLERPTVVIVSAISGITNEILATIDRAVAGDPYAGMRLADRLQCLHSSIAHSLLSDENHRRDIQMEIKLLAAAGSRLCDRIAEGKTCDPRLNDALCGLGERLAARLLAAALHETGLPSVAIDATALIVTCDNHGDAHPDLIATRPRVKSTLTPLLSAGVVPVVTGFIGATVEGATTTLGRGGSDYSATILGAALEAEEVVIWTDVDGVMTADPRLVSEAQTTLN